MEADQNLTYVLDLIIVQVICMAFMSHEVVLTCRCV